MTGEASGGKIHEYKNLCLALRAANVAYREGNSALTNEEYDKKFRRMQRLLFTSPELISHDDFPNEVGYLADDGEEEADLPVQMYSTDNLMTFQEFMDFIIKMLPKGRLIISEKIDGIAVSIKVKNGKIDTICTRGDGKRGKVMKHLSVLFKHHSLEPGNYNVQGEFYALKTIRKTGTNYSSLQSAANGLRTSLKMRPGMIQHVGFKAYGYYPEKDDLSMTYTERLKKLEAMGFDTVFIKDTYNWPMSETHLKVLYQWLEKDYVDPRHPREYDIDGFVVRFDDLKLEKEEGATKRILKAVQAIKFNLLRANSRIINVVFGSGAKGNQSAVAVIEEVVMNGKRVNKVKVPSLSDIPPAGASCVIVLSGTSVPILESYSK